MANNREQIPFRLSLDHVRRLDKVAKYCGQTRQNFVQTAVLSEIAEVEEQIRLKKIKASRFSTTLGGNNDPQPEIDTSSAPSGMGIAEAMMKSRRYANDEQTPQQPQQQSQVVVNVGGAGAGQSVDGIERLAAYVAEGEDYERDGRMRTVVAILRASTSTDEERRTMAARLDEAVAAKLKTQESGVVRTARLAFDKIADMLKGG